MGVYVFVLIVIKEIMERCVKDVFEFMIKGMREDGYLFVGMLFIGFMIIVDGFRVLEYNVRFGDLEI